MVNSVSFQISKANDLNSTSPCSSIKTVSEETLKIVREGEILKNLSSSQNTLNLDYLYNSYINSPNQQVPQLIILILNPKKINFSLFVIRK